MANLRDSYISRSLGPTRLSFHWSPGVISSKSALSQETHCYTTPACKGHVSVGAAWHQVWPSESGSYNHTPTNPHFYDKKRSSATLLTLSTACKKIAWIFNWDGSRRQMKCKDWKAKIIPFLWFDGKELERDLKPFLFDIPNHSS